MEISHICCNVAKDERICGVMDAHFARRQADWSSHAFLDCKIFQRDNGPTQYLLGQVHGHFEAEGQGMWRRWQRKTCCERTPMSCSA